MIKQANNSTTKRIGKDKLKKYGFYKLTMLTYCFIAEFTAAKSLLDRNFNNY